MHVSRVESRHVCRRAGELIGLQLEQPEHRDVAAADVGDGEGGDGYWHHKSADSSLIGASATEAHLSWSHLPSLVLTKHWGPIIPLPACCHGCTGCHNRTSLLFRLKAGGSASTQGGSRQGRQSSLERPVQWGFVLDAPYCGAVRLLRACPVEPTGVTQGEGRGGGCG